MRQKVKFNIARKGLVLVSIPLICELSFLVVLWVTISQAQADLDKISLAREVIARADAVSGVIMQLTSKAAAYQLTHNPKHRKSMEESSEIIMEQCEFLSQVLADNPEQAETVALLRKHTESIVKSFRQLQLRPLGLSLNSLNSKGANTGISDDSLAIGRALKTLVHREEAIQQRGPQEREMFAHWLVIILSTGLLMNILVTWRLAVFYRRSITGRLASVAKNAELLTGSSRQTYEKVGGADEIAELDNALSLAADDLQQLARSRKRLVALLSGRMEEPLARVREITSQIMTSGNLEPKVEERLVNALESSERLLRLIQDLKTLESPQHMKEITIPLRIGKVGIAETAESAWSTIRELANAKSITLSVDVPLGLNVVGDPDRLVQVLINLLSNAVRYTPEGSHIKVSAQALSDVIEIRVSDNGPGIPAAAQSRIFEVYEYVDAAESEAKGGSGLGLAITRQIVEQHGGEITVSSEVGVGSTFVVKLPRNLSSGSVPSLGAATQPSG